MFATTTGEIEMSNLVKRIYQCEKNTNMVLIVNALVWAAVIILGSWLMRGSENADALFIVLLTGSTTMFLFSNRSGI